MCLLATFETVAQLQLVSTVKALKVLLLTAHILRLPKDINKDKYFTVNRINNALRPRERGREGGRGREGERDALRPRETRREAGSGRERERTLCNEQ